MPVQIVWDLENDPDGNVQHILEHGLSMDEVDEVLLDPASETDLSRSSGENITFGWTPTGVHIAVLWQSVQDDPLIIRPLTAYPVPPKRRQKKRGR